MVMLSGLGASSVHSLVGWLVGWWSCELFGFDLCLRSRAAVSADPPGVGGGVDFGGPRSPSPPEDRLTGAHVPLPKSRTAAARHSFSPGWNNDPQVIQKPLSKLIDWLFLCSCC